MGRFLSFLILAASSSAALADNWSSCSAGTGPAVVVLGCYGAGPGAYPATCPTGQTFAADDLASRVEADAPDGSPCANGTVQGPAPSLNTDNQYAYFKKCVGSGGEDRGSLGILGSKVCSADASCVSQIGDEIPIASGHHGQGTYCVNHCQADLQDFGSYFAGPVSTPESSHVGYLQITATTCTVFTSLPSDLQPVAPGQRFCMVVNSQQVCASSQGGLLVTVHDMQLDHGPGGTLCGDGQCVESGSVVATDHGTLAQTGTPAPPAPNRTPDVLITPSGGGGPSYSYWAPSSGGSSGGGTTGGGTSGGGTPGVTCGGPDQPECAVKLGGSFAAPTNDKTAPTFSEALTSFNTSIQSAPLISAVSGLANAIPTEGQVPGGDVTLEALGGVTLHLAPPQQVIDAITPILTLLSMCAWVIYSVLIILSS